MIDDLMSEINEVSRQIQQLWCRMAGEETVGQNFRARIDRLEERKEELWDRRRRELAQIEENRFRNWSGRERHESVFEVPVRSHDERVSAKSSPY